MGLSTYFEKKGDTGIVIFAGKGGLGKTTCSAGLSHYMASKKNRKVLCFSTDPQASLSDIFDRDIFGKGLISVIPHLDVVEIDADRRVADYQEEVKQKIRSMYGLTDIPPEIEEYIDSTSAERRCTNPPRTTRWRTSCRRVATTFMCSTCRPSATACV